MNGLVSLINPMQFGYAYSMDQKDLFHVNSIVGSIFYFRNDHWFTSSGNHKIFEEDLILSALSRIIKPAKVVLDIGAHAGSHSVVYSHLNSNLSILAFEPQKRMFDLLQYNIDFSNLANVHPFNLAVGHKSGNTTLDAIVHEPGNDIVLTYDMEAPANFGGVGLGPGGEEVEMIAIDDLKIENCDFIKIDVEGAESLVLLGGIETIRKFRPHIFFESNHTHMTQQTLKSLGIDQALPDARQMLKELGYSQIIKVDDSNYLASYKRDFHFATLILHLKSLKRRINVRQRLKNFLYD